MAAQRTADISPSQTPGDASPGAAKGGDSPPAEGALRRNIRVPGYRIEREIGRGGMATVYRAVQESLGRPVALKILTPTLSADPQFSERFIREGRTVAQLRHSHIVSVYDIGVAGDYHYIAMEYVDADNLKSRIQRGLSPKEALDITRKIALALGYAHAKGFVHRDVKPENILFREDGNPVLTDFGIAKTVGSTTRLTTTGISIGTPHYMSPEQVRGQPTDGRSDLYALGIVLYEMLTGKAPYRGKEAIAVAYSHVNDPLPELPAEFSRIQPILSRLLAKDPGDRFPNAEALVAALDQLRKANQRRSTPASTGSRRMAQHLPSRRLPAWMIGTAGAAGAVVVVAILALLWGRAPTTEEGAPSPAPVATAEPPEATPAPAADIARKPTTTGAATGPAPSSVDDLLAQANRAMDEGRYIDPVGDNALEGFRSVLSREPGNPEARRGIEHIARHYLETAQTQLAETQLDEALANVDRGLAAAPGHPQLLALKNSVIEQRDTEMHQQDLATRIEDLLQHGNDNLKRGRLTRPARDNALADFQNALSLDPGNAEARRGIRAIADRYAALARSQLGKGNTDKAAGFAKQGLLVVADHPALLKLSEQIDARRREEQAPADGGRAAYAEAERHYYGQDTEQDYSMAVAMYEHAAKGGNADAMFSLGVAYALGQGVPKNEIVAVDWFDKAAAKSNRLAEYHLGLAYAQGRGVGQDDARAVEWFRLAAAQELNRAYKKLGWMYQTGRGVEKDWQESVRWYSRAGRKDLDNALGTIGGFFANRKNEDAAEKQGEKYVETWEFGDPEP
jgi:serine/threonine-protein kinase PpkA